MGRQVPGSPATSDGCRVHAPTPDLSGDGPCHKVEDLPAVCSALSRAKSGKKRAIEERLAKRARTSCGRLSDAATPCTLTSPFVCVPACSDCPASSSDRWCGTDVKVPALDWSSILAGCNASRLAPGEAGEVYHLRVGQEVTVVVVENVSSLPRALAQLKESMHDDLVAVDLEWRPAVKVGAPTRVALLQLASSSMCVLIRLCMMGAAFPACLATFFRYDLDWVTWCLTTAMLAQHFDTDDMYGWPFCAGRSRSWDMPGIVPMSSEWSIHTVAGRLFSARSLMFSASPSPLGIMAMALPHWQVRCWAAPLRSPGRSL